MIKNAFKALASGSLVTIAISPIFLGTSALAASSGVALGSAGVPSSALSTGIYSPESVQVDTIGGDPVFEISWKTAARKESFLANQQFTTYVENRDGLYSLPSDSSTDGWTTRWRSTSQGVSVTDMASKDTSHDVSTHRVKVRATNGMREVDLRHSPGFAASGPQSVTLPLYPTAGGSGNSAIWESFYWERETPAVTPGATCSKSFLCSGSPRIEKWYLKDDSTKAGGDTYAGHVVVYTHRVNSSKVRIVDAHYVLGTTQSGTHNKGNVNIALEGWHQADSSSQVSSTGWLKSPDSMKQDRVWHRISNFNGREISLKTGEKLSARFELIYDRGGESDPRDSAITEKRTHP